MKRYFIRSAFAVLSLLAAGFAQAENAQEIAVRKLIEPKIGAGVKVDSVRETPYGGLYEIRTGMDLLYTDRKAQYLFVGHVFDAKTSQDLTKVRLDDIGKIKFNDLPFDLALKTVKGNGKRVIAVFEDPNCGYCKRFRKDTVKAMDNITVYTFMYNILSEDSHIKSKNIWCSADRNKAWDQWMVEGKAAPTAAAACATPNERVFALGQKMHVEGTPSIFFTDGTRVAGAIDAKALEAKLSSIK